MPTKGTGKVRPESNNPFEDVGFAIADTFDLVDEVVEELNHIDKMVLKLEKKSKAQQKEIEALRKRLRGGKLRR